MFNNLRKMVLPHFEHSYETIVHKNVYSSYILIIPDGVPSYLWITSHGAWLKPQPTENCLLYTSDAADE